MDVRMNGEVYTPRALTLGELRKARAATDDMETDALCVAWSLGCRVEEVRAFFERATAGESIHVIGLVMKASDLDEGATFPGSASNDDVGVGATVNHGLVQVPSRTGAGPHGVRVG